MKPEINKTNKKPMAWIMRVRDEVVAQVPLGVARHYQKIGTAMIIAFCVNGKIH